MNRIEFIKTGIFSSIGLNMVTSLNSLSKLSRTLGYSSKMPVLFLGHGSPMNGIEDNNFVREFRNQGKELQKPKAILVVSAHWETKGTKVTAMENPRTIHDFGGFPKELYEIQYPAPGSPEIAKDLTKMKLSNHSITEDHEWGLDHGSWTVVKHLFPNADVPVLQLSLDRALSPKQHYELAKELKILRDKGILIIGSGNMTHNLGKLAWSKINENYGFDWAEEANTQMVDWVKTSNHENLINYKNQGAAFNLAIPTPEHYLPLLYILALSDKKDEIDIFNDQYLGGSLSMTSVKFF